MYTYGHLWTLNRISENQCTSVVTDRLGKALHLNYHTKIAKLAKHANRAAALCGPAIFV